MAHQEGRTSKRNVRYWRDVVTWTKIELYYLELRALLTREMGPRKYKEYFGRKYGQNGPKTRKILRLMFAIVDLDLKG